MERVTTRRVAHPTLPTREVEVPEWDGTVLLRAITRAQVRDARGRSGWADGKLDLDTYDMVTLAYSFADPDLVAEEGVEEAVALLRAQPVGLIYRLLQECVGLSGMAREAPKSGGTGDDDRRRGVPGASDSEGPGGDDSRGDAAPDVASGVPRP
jgi:hypothetical protein